MTINGETLKAYRKTKRYTQDELAGESRVSKKTISRIELGEIANPNQSTVKRLAEALRVDVADLAKDASERERTERELKKAGFRKLNCFMDRETSVAYAMVKHQYGVSLRELIEAAPLLMSIVAEGSLAWRRKKANELGDAINTMCAISDKAPQLGFAKLASSAEDPLTDELKSIESKDIFGYRLHQDIEDWYDTTEHNPFADYLRFLCSQIDSEALEIDPDGPSDWKVDITIPNYRIAPDEFERLTGGDFWAEFAIELGHVKISAIPSELLQDDRQADRISWIISQIPEEARRERQEWSDSLPELNL